MRLVARATHTRTGVGSLSSCLRCWSRPLTSLAAPWPLKVILDNVVGTHKAPEWLAPFRSSLMGGHKMELAALAGIATVIIAVLGRRRELHRQLLYRKRGAVGGPRLCACASMTTCSTSH